MRMHLALESRELDKRPQRPSPPLLLPPMRSTRATWSVLELRIPPLALPGHPLVPRRKFPRHLCPGRLPLHAVPPKPTLLEAGDP